MLTDDEVAEIKARFIAVIKGRDHDILILRDEYSTAMATIADLREELAQWQNAAGSH
jgi:hypothetical protein